MEALALALAQAQAQAQAQVLVLVLAQAQAQALALALAQAQALALVLVLALVMARRVLVAQMPQPSQLKQRSKLTPLLQANRLRLRPKSQRNLRKRRKQSLWRSLRSPRESL